MKHQQWFSFILSIIAYTLSGLEITPLDNYMFVIASFSWIFSAIYHKMHAATVLHILIVIVLGSTSIYTMIGQ